jgi:hypothetical protein
MPAPARFRWTDHALAKAQVLGISHTDVETAVLEGHGQRRRNAGEAEWRVTSGGLVVLYDHPDGDDPATARIVTIWRRR